MEKPPKLEACVIQHCLVFDWMLNRRFWNNLFFPNDRYPMAHHIDYDVGCRKWHTNLDCPRNSYFIASDAVHPCPKNSLWHVSHFDGIDGSCHECRRCSSNGWGKTDSLGHTHHVACRVPYTTSIQLLASESTRKVLPLERQFWCLIVTFNI